MFKIWVEYDGEITILIFNDDDKEKIIEFLENYTNSDYNWGIFDKLNKLNHKESKEWINEICYDSGLDPILESDMEE